MGPVIDETAAADIISRLLEAQSGGAKLLFGGTRDGVMVKPTIMSDVGQSTRLFATETFGPVLALRRFGSLDQVITELNASAFGLQAGIFTNDHAAIRNLGRNLQVGGLMVNEGPDFRAEHVPFGGVKGSGLGREGVRIALREMSETRVVID